MSVTRIASRYAKSLIDLAIEQKKLDRVKEDVDSFKTLTQNRDFYLLLKSPIVSPPKKKSVFKALLANKYDELTLAFLNILVDKNREAYLPEIAHEFIHQYRVHRHITTVKLITATPISKETVDAIRQKLVESDATDEKVEVITAVDPAIQGGFVLEFDDSRLYDASVARKLEMLKKDFTENLYISQIVSR
ncbi:MAG: ATP synthase F1 subunit delta [Saprospiraceae bacterium]|nr:ATP synthase F1 subunit delta [Saprospiraceae bacterium]MCB0624521.1 ATP synthase F1 subunit delta [Saprospiraceae bacterium]MCB0675198.1 ATP synthase F1 subunit delta [Saprospiraceae bacterium]MCB0680105.1 ATP synthase F1 subunit delta [Saprospiraceae bacterium]